MKGGAEMATPQVAPEGRIVPRRPRRSFQTKEGLTGVLFLSPAFIFLIAFVFIPLIYLFYVSQLNWNLISSPHYIGFANYRHLMSDPYFGQTVRNTIVFTGGVMLLTLPTAFFTAMLLNMGLKEKAFYRSAFLAPYVFPLVASGIVWTLMMEPQQGVLNWFLSLLNITGPAWLSSATWAMISIIMVTTWQYFGFYTLIFLSGLQGVPRELLAAADVDGASSFRRLISITLPMMSPSLFFATVIMVIQSFQAFTQVYVMTQGGPDGATTTVVFYLYQEAFQFFQMGPAAAVAVLLLLSLVLLTLAQLWASRRWVYYEA